MRIGAIDLSLFSHAVLYNIELISPTDDTIFVGRRVDCRFHRFPVNGEGLQMNRVEVDDARFHLAIFSRPGELPSLNLSYIINYFGGDKKEHKPPVKPFSVDVGEVVLDGVDYVMDLPPTGSEAMRRASDSLASLPAPRGVSIPHMRYYDIHARIHNVNVVGDHVKCRVLSLSTTEAGGMRVEDFSAKVEVCRTKIEAQDMRLETGSSMLMCDARLDYDGWESMSDYCHNVWHDLTIKPGSRANVNESSWWAPVLWGVDCLVGIEGHCYGAIDNLHVDSIKATFGTESHFDVRGTIVGLPQIDTTRMDVVVSDFHTTMEDVAAVKLPHEVSIEPLLKKFSHVRFFDIDALLKGSPTNCSAKLALNSGIGDIRAEASVGYDSLQKKYAYAGCLHSNALGIHDVLPNEWLSRTGVNITFEGSGNTLANLNANLDGTLVDTRFRGVDLDKTTLVAKVDDGRMTLNAAIDDSLLSCTLDGSMQMDKGECHLALNLDRGMLTSLGLLPKADSVISLSGRLTADLVSGDTTSQLFSNLDALQGTVRMKNTHCAIGSRDVTLQDLLLSIASADGRKNLSLECDWFDAAVNGWFSYADLPLLVDDFSQRYLPGGQKSVEETPSDSLWRSDAFYIDVVWRDADSTFPRLVPGCNISSGTTLHGNYNYTESLKVVVRSDQVAFGSVALHDMGVTSSIQGGVYNLRLRVGDVAVSGMDLLKELKADADLGGRLSSLALRWGDAVDTTSTAADLQFFLTGEDDAFRLSLTRPYLYLFGQRWILSFPGGILFSDGTVDVSMLRLFSRNQSLTAKALLGGNGENFAKVQFDAFSLASFSDVIMAREQLSVDGVVTGTFDLLGLESNPYFVADLSIEDLTVNGQSAGHVVLKSDWESTEKRINVDLSTEKHFPDRTSRPIEIRGSFLADGTHAMDLDVGMHRISLQTIGPLITGFSSNIDGLLSCSLHLGGTLNAPDLQGRAWVDGGLIHVDATGVTYYFDDTLLVEKDSLVLNDFIVRDGAANHAVLGGSMVYRDKELLMDLALQTEKLVVLDSKAEGDGFYGRLLVGAQGSISGDMQHPAIYVRAQTIAGSEIHVPVTSRKQMNENTFVHFVNYESASRTAAPVKKKSNLDLQVDLSVTPGLKLMLPMDFSEITADVEAAGLGDLRLTMKGDNEPSVVGRYDFSSGRFSLSLLQLIEKNFTIEEGSSLLFPGNIQDARFDVKAVYNQRVNLSTLTGASTSGSTTEYTQVQNVIAVAGTLDNPSLKFDIRLPNAEQSTVDQVNSLINLSSDRDMLNHTVSLLLLGRFASTGTANQGEDLFTGGINSINVVASTMGNMVSNLVKVVDVDFKVQQAQIDVGISKQWDKLYFESSFGYGSANSTETYNPELSNVLVGDVMVGYKINPSFSFYGFHRTNTSYYSRSEIPYKQGIGLKWTKDFDRLSDLFRKKNDY